MPVTYTAYNVIKATIFRKHPAEKVNLLGFDRQELFDTHKNL